jgi:hypothetical protein
MKHLVAFPPPAIARVHFRAMLDDTSSGPRDSGDGLLICPLHRRGGIIMAPGGHRRAIDSFKSAKLSLATKHGLLVPRQCQFG